MYCNPKRPCCCTRIAPGFLPLKHPALWSRMTDYGARGPACLSHLALSQKWAAHPSPPRRLIHGTGSRQSRHCVPNNERHTH
ncbi:hypothetical protein GN956_G22160 [Arapaima gigas]